MHGLARPRCVIATPALQTVPADSHLFEAAVIPLLIMVVQATSGKATAEEPATDQASEQSEGWTTAIDPDGLPSPRGLDSTIHSAAPPGNGHLAGSENF